MKREQKTSNTIDSVFNVSGMWCASCAKSLEKKISSTAGVNFAAVDFATSQLLVSHSCGLSSADLENSAKSLGYRISDIFSTIESGEDQNLTKAYFVRLAWVSFFSMWSLLFSISFYTDRSERLFLYLSAISALPAFALGIWPFAKMAYLSVRAKTLTFDLLVIVANTLLLTTSFHSLISSNGKMYFETVGMTLTLILASRYLDAKLRNNLKVEVYDLFQKSVGITRAFINSEWVEAPAQSLREGRIVAIGSGESLFHDLRVQTGGIWVNTSQVNGESNPVYRSIGDIVHAGEFVLDGNCEGVIIEPVGSRWIDKHVFSFLSEFNRGRKKGLFDRLMNYWVPAALVSAALLFGLNVVAGLSLWSSLSQSATLLLVACPCALALIQPMSRMIAKKRLLNKGVILNRPSDWHPDPRRTDLFFDKTGTLTVAEYQRANLTSVNNFDHAELAFLLASASWGVEHPYSRATVDGFNGTIDRSGLRKILPGIGVSWSRENGQRVEVRKVDCDKEPEYLKYQSVITLDEKIVGGIHFRQITMPYVLDTLSKLKHSGYCLHLVSGDVKENATEILSSGAFHSAYFGQSPEEKKSIIELNRRHGRDSIFIGDGLNDIQAMAASDFSIGISQKNGNKNLLSDAVLDRENIFLLPEILKIINLGERRTRWAFVAGSLYNAVTIAFILMGLLHPLIVVASMSATSILIILFLGTGLRTDTETKAHRDAPLLIAD